MDLNRATVIGRLVRDPEMRTTPNGRTVTSITVVTNMVWTDQSGNKQEKPEFHNIVLWGKLGEIAGQYLHKASRAYVEGRLETRDWVGQDSVKRYRTEIIGDNLIMLDGPRGDGGSQNMSAASRPAQTPASAPESGEEEIKVEDIPF